MTEELRLLRQGWEHYIGLLEPEDTNSPRSTEARATEEVRRRYDGIPAAAVMETDAWRRAEDGEPEDE